MAPRSFQQVTGGQPRGGGWESDPTADRDGIDQWRLDTKRRSIRRRPVRDQRTHPRAHSRTDPNAPTIRHAEADHEADDEPDRDPDPGADPQPGTQSDAGADPGTDPGAYATAHPGTHSERTGTEPVVTCRAGGSCYTAAAV
jgi:hypothetical protein